MTLLENTQFFIAVVAKHGYDTIRVTRLKSWHFLLQPEFYCIPLLVVVLSVLFCQLSASILKIQEWSPRLTKLRHWRCYSIPFSWKFWHHFWTNPHCWTIHVKSPCRFFHCFRLFLTFPLSKAMLEVHFCQLVKNLRRFCFNRFHTCKYHPLQRLLDLGKQEKVTGGKVGRVRWMSQHGFTYLLYVK